MACAKWCGDSNRASYFGIVIGVRDTEGVDLSRVVVPSPLDGTHLQGMLSCSMITLDYSATRSCVSDEVVLVVRDARRCTVIYPDTE